jgi:hypothetical protein
MKASVAADWTQVAANLLTALAIISAGIASFRLRLFAGRPEITITTRLGARPDKNIVLITVNVKNVGRGPLRVRNCFITTAPFSIPQIDPTTTPVVVGFHPRDPDSNRDPFQEVWVSKVRSLFRGVSHFLQDEAMEEALTLAVAGESDLLAIDVTFIADLRGYFRWVGPRSWTSSRVLDLHEDERSEEGSSDTRQ